MEYLDFNIMSPYIVIVYTIKGSSSTKKALGIVNDGADQNFSSIDLSSAALGLSLGFLAFIFLIKAFSRFSGSRLKILNVSSIRAPKSQTSVLKERSFLFFSSGDGSDFLGFNLGSAFENWEQFWDCKVHCYVVQMLEAYYENIVIIIYGNEGSACLHAR